MDDYITPVASARIAKRMKQSELAEAAGISTPYVKLIDHGYVPPPHVRARVAAALGKGEEELWPAYYDIEGYMRKKVRKR